MNDIRRLAFIGGGNMAAALISGLTKRGLSPKRLVVADPSGEQLARHLAVGRPLVISVAAGIPHASLARWFGPQIPVIRTMPNRPALSGFGATGLYAPAGIGAAYRALAETIMAAVSATVWVEH